MQIRILAATSSLIRRLWYRNEMGSRGCEVITVADGISCVEKAADFRPQILILEPYLTWGGSDGVLAVRESDPNLKSAPVIVIDIRRDASETYRIGAYELAGYWAWPPSADELSTAIHLILDQSESLQFATNRIIESTIP